MVLTSAVAHQSAGVPLTCFPTASCFVVTVVGEPCAGHFDSASCVSRGGSRGCGGVPDRACEGFSDLAGVLLAAFSADGIMSCQPCLTRWS